MISWKQSHHSGNITFKDGYIIVGVTGYYYIYSQMFYRENKYIAIGYRMYIDDRDVTKAKRFPSERLLKGFSILVKLLPTLVRL